MLPEEEPETTAQDRTPAKGQEPTEARLSRTGASVQGTRTQRSNGPEKRFPESNTKCSHTGDQGNGKRKALVSLQQSPPALPLLRGGGAVGQGQPQPSPASPVGSELSSKNGLNLNPWGTKKIKTHIL